MLNAYLEIYLLCLLFSIVIMANIAWIAHISDWNNINSPNWDIFSCLDIYKYKKEKYEYKYLELHTHTYVYNFSFFFFICSEFCHTLEWNTHGFTCVPHPDPPSHLPFHPLPLGFPSAPLFLSFCISENCFWGLT